jgi:hypothetical protein
MEDLGYFMKGVGRAPSEETVMEPNIDEAVVFERISSMSGSACLSTQLW